MNLDEQLLQYQGKIIHQIWFGTIPNKSKAKKAYLKLVPNRDTWIRKNPDWFRVEWNKDMIMDLIKTHYSEHVQLFKSYNYEIQRCDAARYFILHRYGGFYVDMDVECITSADAIRMEYNKNLYLVETGNQVLGTRVSNLLMFSNPRHPFWKQVFLELHARREAPFYYTKHLEIMYSTGPAFLNKMFNMYGIRYRLSVMPFEKFNPLYLGRPIFTIDKSKLHTLHYGSGSWESSDSKIFIFFYCNWRIVLFILIILSLPLIMRSREKHKSHTD